MVSMVSGITLKEIESRAQNLILEGARKTFFSRAIFLSWMGDPLPCRPKQSKDILIRENQINLRFLDRTNKVIETEKQNYADIIYVDILHCF